MRKVISGEIYRHFKGALYQIVTVARHSETKENLVIYQALYGDFSLYARPMDMFLSEVDHEKYPDVKQVYRFEKVEMTSETLNSKTDDNSEQNTVQTENCKSESDCNYKKAEKKESVEKSEIQEDSCKEASQDETTPNQYLLEFLEAETIREKKAVLVSIRNKIDDRLINDISASLDIVIDEGDIDKRFASLLNCLNTMSKFECDRFR